jgi:hypothetical protein
LDAQLGRKVLEVSLSRKQQLGLQTYIVICLHTTGTWFHNPPHRHQCLEELAGCPHASPPQNSLWLFACLLQATYSHLPPTPNAVLGLNLVRSKKK